MTNNNEVTYEILPWEPPTLRSEVNIGKRVHDTKEQFGEGTVLDYDSVEALVQWDNKGLDKTWTHWDDLEFVA